MAQAQALLQFTQESQTSQILALDVNGRVRSLRLLYTVSFRQHHSGATAARARRTSSNGSATYSTNCPAAFCWT